MPAAAEAVNRRREDATLGGGFLVDSRCDARLRADIGSQPYPTTKFSNRFGTYTTFRTSALRRPRGAGGAGGVVFATP